MKREEPPQPKESRLDKSIEWRDDGGRSEFFLDRLNGRTVAKEVYRNDGTRSERVLYDADGSIVIQDIYDEREQPIHHSEKVLYNGEPKFIKVDLDSKTGETVTHTVYDAQGKVEDFSDDRAWKEAIHSNPFYEINEKLGTPWEATGRGSSVEEDVITAWVKYLDGLDLPRQ